MNRSSFVKAFAGMFVAVPVVTKTKISGIVKPKKPIKKNVELSTPTFPKTNTQNDKFAKFASKSILPVGTIVNAGYGCTSKNTHWIVLNGQTIEVKKYPELVWATESIIYQKPSLQYAYYRCKDRSGLIKDPNGKYFKLPNCGTKI
jgi:hypothetical protein